MFCKGAAPTVGDGSKSASSHSEDIALYYDFCPKKGRKDLDYEINMALVETQWIKVMKINRKE